MKKFLTTLIINLLFCSVSFAQPKILYCIDDKVSGFDANTQYSKVINFKPLRFKIKMDLDKKESILSDEVGMKKGFVTCRHWKATKNFDPMLECMGGADFIVINLKNYNYTRFVGFAHTLTDQDDMVFGYGRCDEF
tara:strand:+ start:166 stop:573 length:408 start_codon:yes stop_codon:yes gene_type:complete